MDQTKYANIFILSANSYLFFVKYSVLDLKFDFKQPCGSKNDDVLFLAQDMIHAKQPVFKI